MVEFKVSKYTGEPQWNSIKIRSEISNVDFEELGKEIARIGDDQQRAFFKGFCQEMLSWSWDKVVTQSRFIREGISGTKNPMTTEELQIIVELAGQG